MNDVENAISNLCVNGDGLSFNENSWLVNFLFFVNHFSEPFADDGGDASAWALISNVIVVDVDPIRFDHQRSDQVLIFKSFFLKLDFESKKILLELQVFFFWD